MDPVAHLQYPFVEEIFGFLCIEVFVGLWLPYGILVQGRLQMDCPRRQPSFFAICDLGFGESRFEEGCKYLFVCMPASRSGHPGIGDDGAICDIGKPNDSALSLRTCADFFFTEITRGMMVLR
jgi:hypothetical protein